MPVDQSEWTHPDLQALLGLFFQDSTQLGRFRLVSEQQLPPSIHGLIAHNSHMTVAIERFHGTSVNLKVRNRNETASHYSREIVLLHQATSAVLQYGIVRLNTALFSPTIMAEIKSESIPLGKILIDNGIMRQVKLMSIWQIAAGPRLQQIFNRDGLRVCYGRTALIYTDGMPAIELLEIVPDESEINPLGH
ncbi:MAG TPA: hypothetical protein PKD64_08400 [Pirellulaceae bacterium]|nr:hypothetical protein [Pirellulaceae bacterium]HMP68866.1 hypothetical protein [Pirellulaceae bacterium]